MKNVKDDESFEAKGCISCTLGDKKYFGIGQDNIMNKNNGFYGNSHYYILGKFKG